MHVKPQLIIHHQWIFEAQSRLNTLHRQRAVPENLVYEAEEALQYAKVSALVDLLTGEFSHGELRTLVERLNRALQE